MSKFNYSTDHAYNILSDSDHIGSLQAVMTAITGKDLGSFHRQKKTGVVVFVSGSGSPASFLGNVEAKSDQDHKLSLNCDNTDFNFLRIMLIDLLDCTPYKPVTRECGFTDTQITFHNETFHSTFLKKVMGGKPKALRAMFLWNNESTIHIIIVTTENEMLDVSWNLTSLEDTLKKYPTEGNDPARLSTIFKKQLLPNMNVAKLPSSGVFFDFVLRLDGAVAGQIPVLPHTSDAAVVAVSGVAEEEPLAAKKVVVANEGKGVSAELDVRRFGWATKQLAKARGLIKKHSEYGYLHPIRKKNNKLESTRQNKLIKCVVFETDKDAYEWELENRTRSTLQVLGDGRLIVTIGLTRHAHIYGSDTIGLQLVSDLIPDGQDHLPIISEFRFDGPYNAEITKAHNDRLAGRAKLPAAHQPVSAPVGQSANVSAAAPVAQSAKDAEYGAFESVGNFQSGQPNNKLKAMWGGNPIKYVTFNTVEDAYEWELRNKACLPLKHLEDGRLIVTIGLLASGHIYHSDDIGLQLVSDLIPEGQDHLLIKDEFCFTGLYLDNLKSGYNARDQGNAGPVVAQGQSVVAQGQPAVAQYQKNTKQIVGAALFSALGLGSFSVIPSMALASHTAVLQMATRALPLALSISVFVVGLAGVIVFGLWATSKASGKSKGIFESREKLKVAPLAVCDGANGGNTHTQR